MRIRLLLPLFLSGVSMAQPAGSFIPTGAMTTPRNGHTATLLPNGNVLVAGGNLSTGTGNLPQFGSISAELYDPSTGTFTATGDMTTARVFHTATLLPNGKVLIAGGIRTRSAEVYDPSTGTFTATGDMVTENDSVPVNGVLLADGKVLFVHDGAAELYDSVSGTFSATAGSPAPLLLNYGPSRIATLLNDGRVLLANSFYAQLYDPASCAIGLTSAPNPGVLYSDGFAAAPLTNGKVLVAGGYCEECNAFSAGAVLYDPLTGTFTPTGDMSAGRAFHTATPLGDGTVLIAGGSQAIAASTNAKLYDPPTGMFSRTGNMTTSRLSGHSSTLLLDGTVLIAGGNRGNNISFNNASLLASAELYKPSVPVPAPLLFSISANGHGQGAIWHATSGVAASSSNPAVDGEILSMYTTSLADGGVVPPQVAVGGRLAQIQFFGDAPGYPGYYQVNFQVPAGVAAGSAVPVRLTYLGRSSNRVTIGVQ